MTYVIIKFPLLHTGWGLILRYIGFGSTTTRCVKIEDNMCYLAVFGRLWSIFKGRSAFVVLDVSKLRVTCVKIEGNTDMAFSTPRLTQYF